MNHSQAQLEKWSHIRKDGKTHYAITRGLFGLGGPLLFGGVFIQIWMAPNQNIYSILGSLVVMIPGCLYFGYRFGRRQWDTLEKQYASSEQLVPPPMSEVVVHEQYVASLQSHDQPSAPPVGDEEAFYEIVATELEQQTHKTGIWTKAFADAGGSPEQARALYIRYRVSQLGDARNRELQEHRRTAAKATRQRTAVGFRRFIYAVLAIICGLLLALCFLFGLAMLFSPDTLGGGIFMAVLSILFGFATYGCVKASQK